MWVGGGGVQLIGGMMWCANRIVTKWSGKYIIGFVLHSTPFPHLIRDEETPTSTESYCLTQCGGDENQRHCDKLIQQCISYLTKCIIEFASNWLYPSTWIEPTISLRTWLQHTMAVVMLGRVGNVPMCEYSTLCLPKEQMSGW